MTLFTLLLVLFWDRLFKSGEHWHLDHRLEAVFQRSHSASLIKTVLMTLCWMLIIWWVLHTLHGYFFGIVPLLLWVVIGLLCIGAGTQRQRYWAYLKAAREGDVNTANKVAQELASIHGLPAEDAPPELRLRELQNALLWINFRYYLAPLFWLVVCGSYGPVALAGYAFLRAYQNWLARHDSSLLRAQSGVDSLLQVFDWIPVRLVGVAYALLGHGERALPAWFASLADCHSPQYQVLTRLAQFSLAREPHLNPIDTPRAAVALARKVTVALVVVVALLTIYGALV